MSYRLTVHIGVFWKSPDIELGSYRWKWVAYLRARLYLWLHPSRAITLHKIDP